MKNKLSITELEIIASEGEILDDWAGDMNKDGELESNGSVEYLVAKDKKYYLIQSEWGGLENVFGGQELDIDEELKEDGFVAELIREHMKQV